MSTDGAETPVTSVPTAPLHAEVLGLVVRARQVGIPVSVLHARMAHLALLFRMRRENKGSVSLCCTFSVEIYQTDTADYVSVIFAENIIKRSP